MNLFSISPVQRFHGVNTSIKRPIEIACYSVDRQRKVHPFSDEHLRFYYPPFFDSQSKQHVAAAVKPDLSSGYDKFIKRDESVDEHIDGLLDTIMALETRTGEVLQTDIVAFRGQITKIMTAPFDRYADFEMNATCYQGAIYLEENHSYRNAGKAHQSGRPTKPSNNEQELFQYWGYKFEQLATLSKPWAECTRDEIEGRDSEACDNIAEYCSVVRTGIGSSTLVIGGEVDCVLGQKPEDSATWPIPWVELKTSKKIESDRDAINFENKMCRFWAQSFLLGVPTVVVGWRTKNGFLVDLEEINTQKIPTKVKREGRGTWDGNVCINFAAQFFEFLKATLRPSDPTSEGVWRLEFKKGMPGIGVHKVQATGTGRLVKEEFKAHRQEMTKRRSEQDQQAAKEVLAHLGH